MMHPSGRRCSGRNTSAQGNPRAPQHTLVRTSTHRRGPGTVRTATKPRPRNPAPTRQSQAAGSQPDRHLAPARPARAIVAAATLTRLMRRDPRFTDPHPHRQRRNRRMPRLAVTKRTRHRATRADAKQPRRHRTDQNQESTSLHSPNSTHPHSPQFSATITQLHGARPQPLRSTR